MPGDFVVGIGGDGSGFEAARVAAQYASAAGSRLVLVFGIEASRRAPNAGPLIESMTAIGEEATAQIQSELTALWPTLTIETEILMQRPADALIAVAERREASTIAVGHGGQGPLRAALLGNVTYEIVHRSTIPVLVVPNDDEVLVAE
jgi:nucleotide-binding universal stress UspA family protein